MLQHTATYCNTRTKSDNTEIATAKAVFLDKSDDGCHVVRDRDVQNVLHSE